MAVARLQDLIDRFELFAPPALAHPKDPIGLHFGHREQKISRMMTTLDVRPAVVEEAIEKGVDLIFAHHPPIFKAIESFDLAIPQNKMYADILQAGIAVYAAHTNLDSTEAGMNDWLAELLALEDTQLMSINGQYEGKDYGYGRVGVLEKEVLFSSYVEELKETFAVSGLRYVGKDFDKTIKRVAIMGGSGGNLYHKAVEAGADLYITGDISYHQAHDIEESGMLVVDPGHNIEKICVPHLADLFKKWAKEEDWELDILESQVQTDPFYFA